MPSCGVTRSWLALVLCSGLIVCGAGCSLGALVGGMADSANRLGSTTYEAEYTGLQSHTFAVVATTDRGIQAEFPALLPTLVQRLDLVLAEHAGASGHVPGDEVTGYLANNPQWVAWPRSQLAEELNVDRVIYIEVNDFRTNEPGNEYVWDGLVWATLSVIERGAVATDVEAYRKDLQIHFPDQTGYGPNDFSKQVVASELLRRLIERSGWLFYKHEEKNSLEY